MLVYQRVFSGKKKLHPNSAKTPPACFEDPADLSPSIAALRPPGAGSPRSAGDDRSPPGRKPTDTWGPGAARNGPFGESTESTMGKKQNEIYPWKWGQNWVFFRLKMRTSKIGIQSVVRFLSNNLGEQIGGLSMEN